MCCLMSLSYISSYIDEKFTGKTSLNNGMDRYILIRINNPLNDIVSIWYLKSPNVPYNMNNIAGRINRDRRTRILRVPYDS